MQTLGLSDTTPRTESRLRALFWPTIRNGGDLDYVTEQGFWICFVVSVQTLVMSVFSGVLLAGLFESLFYFLAGAGVRERSRAAGLAAFFAYLLGVLVIVRYSGRGVGFLQIVFLALLFANVRGNWLAARWKPDPGDDFKPTRLNASLTDKLADQLPAFLWPKVSFLFYILASLELTLLLISLLAPIQ